jgi:chemotaxis methyl-accepting protein methylase
LTEFANRTGRPGRLRVWSPGCSDGAELYSVAILLDELGLLDRCELLGTDCRADAVERARAGAYDAHAVRCVPPDLLARHFTTDADRRTWRVSPRLRAAARWRTADVLNVCEPGVWDLVLCRNLAIYLQPEAAGELWRRLEAAVRPGGVLALGKAERPGSGRRFTPAGPCLFRRSGAADGDGMNGTVGTDRAGGTRSATSPNGANTGARHV